MADMSAHQLNYSSSPRTPTSEGVRKRRALTACKQCRKRKVRCDIEHHGPPCTNCRFDQEVCVVATNKRRSIKIPDYSNSDKAGNYSRQSTCQQNELLVSREQGRRADVDSSQMVFPLTVYESLAPAQEESIYTEALPTYRRTQSSISPNTAEGPPHDCEHVCQETLKGPQMAFEDRLPSTNQTTVKLPPYIQPPRHIPQEDIDYIFAKKAFNVPCARLRNSLLRSYVDWVYPYCPSLDLNDFLSAIAAGDGSRGTISLLVLHAVMLAGAAFVGISYLHEAGYPTRLAARKDFFSRAKCLYGLKYEEDRLRIVQALLLMSYWQEEHDESMNHWYWCALACNTGRSIGLHRDPNTSSMPPKAKKLWRRVGWSCFLRDHGLCLGVRQPPTIRPGEFDIPLLSQNDFEITEFPSAVVSMLEGCVNLRHTSHQLQLAQMCIEKTKLCVLIGKIFATQYVAMTPKLGTTNELTLILMPNDSKDVEASRSKLQLELDNWLTELPGELQYQTPPFVQPKPGVEVLSVHRSLLHMLYHAIVLTLYRPVMTNSAQSLVASSEIIRRRLRQSAASITRQCEDLQNQDLIWMLPSIGVTTLLTAAVNHLEESTTLYGSQGEQSLRRFWDCLAYLRTLQEVHVYAKFAAIFISSLAHQTGVFPLSDYAEHELHRLGPWARAHMPGRLSTPPHAEGVGRLIAHAPTQCPEPNTNTYRSAPISVPIDMDGLGGGNAYVILPTQVEEGLNWHNGESFIGHSIWAHGWGGDLNCWTGFDSNLQLPTPERPEVSSPRLSL